MTNDDLLYRDGLQAWQIAMLYVKGPSGYLGEESHGSGLDAGCSERRQISQL